MVLCSLIGGRHTSENQRVETGMASLDITPKGALGHFVHHSALQPGGPGSKRKYKPAKGHSKGLFELKVMTATRTPLSRD